MRAKSRADSTPLRQLLRLMKGASLMHWKSLFSFVAGAGNLCSLYNYESCTTSPCPRDIPWPVQWLLSTFSKKYIFINNSAPKIQPIIQSLNQFVNKIKWKWVHRNSEPQSFRNLGIRSARTPTCNKLIDPILNGWLLDIRRRIIGKAISLVRGRAHGAHSNTFPLVTIALRQLKRLPYAVLQRDKEPGFCLIPISDFRKLELSVLSGCEYRPILASNINLQSTRKAFASIAKRIQDAQSLPGLAHSLTKSLYVGSFFAKLGLQVKTHKHSGEITCRNLHKSANYALQGLSAWITEMLTTHISIAHNVRDSQQITNEWHQHPVDSTCKLATLNIKNFFMSGECQTLWQDVMSEYSGPLPSLVSELLYLLLSEQYITCSSDATRLDESIFDNQLHNFGTDSVSFFRVLRGSGMGLMHSAIVANTSFFVRCEKPLLGRFESYNIRKYGRYFDDTLVLYSDSALFQDFCECMRSSANHFTLLCSEVSSREVDFLDLTVKFQGSHLSVNPHFNRPVAPLHACSGHPKHVHDSWPKAIMTRNIKLAGSMTAQEVSNVLLAKYRQYNASNRTLSILARCNHNTHMQPTIRSPASLDDDEAQAVWLKLPSHPLWVQGFPGVLAKMPFSVFGKLRVRPSWYNGYPSLSMQVGHTNTRAFLEQEHLGRMDGEVAEV